MSVEPLEQAIESTRGILGNIDRTDLDRSTPCASWKVSDLVNHIVGGQFFFATAVRGGQPSGEQKDYSTGDFLADFNEGSAATLAAFNEDGAMERIVHLPFGDMPGAVFLNVASTDTFVHGWDLARATGQPTDLEPELAASLLATVGPLLPESARGEDGKSAFAPEQPAPDGASNADRLAAFLGRTV